VPRRAASQKTNWSRTLARRAVEAGVGAVEEQESRKDAKSRNAKETDGRSWKAERRETCTPPVSPTGQATRRQRVLRTDGAALDAGGRAPRKRRLWRGQVVVEAGGVASRATWRAHRQPGHGAGRGPKHAASPLRRRDEAGAGPQASSLARAVGTLHEDDFSCDNRRGDAGQCGEGESGRGGKTAQREDGRVSVHECLRLPGGLISDPSAPSPTAPQPVRGAFTGRFAVASPAMGVRRVVAGIGRALITPGVSSFLLFGRNTGWGQRTETEENVTLCPPPPPLRPAAHLKSQFKRPAGRAPNNRFRPAASA